MACKTTLQFYNSSNASDPRLLQSWGGGLPFSSALPGGSGWATVGASEKVVPSQALPRRPQNASRRPQGVPMTLQNAVRVPNRRQDTQVIPKAPQDASKTRSERLLELKKIQKSMQIFTPSSTSVCKRFQNESTSQVWPLRDPKVFEFCCFKLVFKNSRSKTASFLITFWCHIGSILPPTSTNIDQ